MERDEDRTLARLKAHRKEFLEPLIAEHQGRIVKLMGDGTLVEFGSVVDAVRCAVLIQRGMAEREADGSETERIRLRIGINLGDVIHEADGDLYGDGVNVAARLEQLADPGGVLISGTAYDHLKGKLDVAVEPKGKQRLKNIGEPVRTYRVRMEPASIGKAAGAIWWASPMWRWAAASLALLLLVGLAAWLRPWQPRVEAASLERMAFPLPSKPSLAVLPFRNMSSGPEQDYFVDGLTDDLITDLSKVSGLFIIARGSVFQFKGRDAKVREAAESLGVRYVVNGSVRRAGNAVRVNVELIDAIHRRPALGRSVRRQPRQHLRGSGQVRPSDRRGTVAEALEGGRAGNRPRANQQCRRARGVPEGLGAHPAVHERRERPGYS
jgi:adenylate cyclase